MEWRFISFIPVESLTSEMGYIFTELKLVLLAVFLVGILMTLFSAYKSYNPLRKLLVQLDVQGTKGKNEYELLEDSIATLRKQQRKKKANFISSLFTIFC